VFPWERKKEKKLPAGYKAKRKKLRSAGRGGDLKNVYTSKAFENNKDGISHHGNVFCEEGEQKAGERKNSEVLSGKTAGVKKHPICATAGGGTGTSRESERGGFITHQGRGKKLSKGVRGEGPPKGGQHRRGEC